MADNSVFITGAAEGAFTDALNGLPPWATQDTAQDIEQILKKTLKVQTDAFSKLVKAMSNGGLLDPDDLKGFNDELKKISDELKRDSPKRKKRIRDEEEEHTRAQRRWKDWAREYPKSIAALGLIAAAGIKVKEVFEQNVNVFDRLTKAGVNVVAGFDSASNGFTALRDLTVLTSVRFTELAGAIEKYNTAVNSIGLGKFAKAVAMSSQDLQQFGFTTKESAELLGSYLETQLGAANTQNRSAEETSIALKKYAERVNKLSLVTGQSRNAIMANIEAISKSNEASILSAQIGYEAADATMAFIGSLKNQNLGRSLLKMMTDQIKPLNETFMSFQKIGLGGFGTKLMAFTQSLKGLDPAEQAQRIKAFTEANRAEIEHGKQQANLYSQVPELAGEANKALTTFNELQQTARSTVTMSAEDLKKQADTQKARTRLANEWERLQSQFQKTFAVTIPMLNFLATGLSKVNGVIETVADWLKGNTLKTLWDKVFSITATEFQKGARNLWDSLKQIFSFENIKTQGMAIGKAIQEGVLDVINAPLSDLVGTILAVAGAFAAFKTAGMIKDMVFGSRGGASGDSGGARRSRRNSARGGKGGLSNILGDIGSPKVLLGAAALVGIASALWIAGKAIKDFAAIKWEDMGKAAAAIVGLGVAGAAAGAFAPGILLGAAALAAMGGALWVIGKAMQAVGPGLTSLSSGFAAFGAIDGSNLLNVAAGVAALGGALAVFSAASAVAGVGGVVSNITNGLASLTGGDVMSKLKDFAALGSSLQQGVSAINSVSASLTSLSSSLTSFTGLSTLNSIVSAINSIDIAKAMAFAVIGKLGASIGLPPPATPANSSTTKTPVVSSLNSPSKSKVVPDNAPVGKPGEAVKSSAPGTAAAHNESDINSILRYQTSLLEQLVQGNNNIVSVNKDILKYTRVRT